MYKISTHIYNDRINKCYKKILVCNGKPKHDEPLHKLIKTIRREKNSPYENFYCCGNEPHCINGLINPNNNYNFLTLDNVEILFNFCKENGYKIESRLTKMLTTNNLYQNKNIICIISKLI
jgi:hypothetical protein